MEAKYNELKDILKEYIGKISSSAYYCDDIPYKKLENAIASYATSVDASQVLALIDTTVGGSAKEGIIFTTSSMYGNLFLGSKFEVAYKEIECAEIDEYKYSSIRKKMIYQKKDSDRDLNLTICGKENISRTICISGEGTILNKTPFKSMIDKIIELSKEGLIGETDKYIILEDIDSKAKSDYIRVLINFSALEADISGKQINAIYSLMSRIKVGVNERKEIWKYISEQNFSDINEIINEMDSLVPYYSVRVLHLSLIKDILKISGKNPKDLSEMQIEFINNLCSNNIGDIEINFMYEALLTDEKLLSGKINDKEYAKIMTDLGAKAASIGVPIAAIYLSGSVVGLSAAGITSGLAALGLGGVLGLSSMVTGVGVAVVIGMGVHKLIKSINNHTSKDKDNKREYLITEAIKINQITITHLIEDICCINSELVDMTYDLELNKAKISKIAKMLKVFSDALKQSNMKNSDNEDMQNIPLLEG